MNPFNLSLQLNEPCVNIYVRMCCLVFIIIGNQTKKCVNNKCGVGKVGGVGVTNVELPSYVVDDTANFLRCSMNSCSDTSSVSTGAPPSCRGVEKSN